MSFFAPPRPYPPERHTAPDPVTGGLFRPHDAPHDIEYADGGSCDYLVLGTQTRGDYGLYRWNMGPGVSGPDEHFHRAVSESFVVLDGTIRLYDGQRWIDGRPGDVVSIPEGCVHAFRNESGESASMLILFSPGAPRERYFEGLAEIAATGQRPSDDELAEFFARHDTYWI